MVLRGSKTRPDFRLDDIRKEISEAREYLTQSEQEMQEIAHTLHDDLETTLSQAESTPRNFASAPSSPVIVNDASLSRATHLAGINGAYLKIPRQAIPAIRQCIDRLEQLELQHIEAESTLLQKKEEFRVAALQFLCGGAAGVTARSVVAPFDRWKFMLITAHDRKVKYENSHTAVFRDIFNQGRGDGPMGGFRSFWRGNLTNCIRVFPYAALQFMSYERYKQWVMDNVSREGEFGYRERLLSGALSGATAATLTYPLDLMRFQQAVYPEIRTPFQAIRSIYAEGGLLGFYRGWTPTLISLAPFIAINFATFDYLKAQFIPEGERGSSVKILGLGVGAGLWAQSICFPLDVIRRKMQMKNAPYRSVPAAFTGIFQAEGIRGFYRGIVPNAIKIMPNNGIRFLAYSQYTYMCKVPTARKKRD